MATRRQHLRNREPFLTGEIHFLAEQDGPFERILKEKLVTFFERDRSIIRAYLVRADLKQFGEVAVVLGLRTHFGIDVGVVDKIGQVFASIFRDTQRLEILFLQQESESRVAEVCCPFFVASG